MFADICLYTALLRCGHSISSGLRSLLWLGHCNTSISFFQPLCGKFAGVFGIIAKLLSCVWFLQNMVLFIVAKHLRFGLVCPTDIAPEILWGGVKDANLSCRDGN